MTEEDGRDELLEDKSLRRRFFFVSLELLDCFVVGFVSWRKKANFKG